MGYAEKVRREKSIVGQLPRSHTHVEPGHFGHADGDDDESHYFQHAHTPHDHDHINGMQLRTAWVIRCTHRVIALLAGGYDASGSQLLPPL